MKANRLGGWVVVVAIVGGVSGVRAAPLGTAFTYQGQLKASGVPLDGLANMVFKLYDALSGGNLLGTQAANGVPVTNGLFVVELNAGGQFGANAFNGDQRWLEVSVNGTPLLPRQPLTATPYALQSRGIFADDAGNVGIGTNTPHHRLRISGGQAWTSSLWSGALELNNAAAIGWQGNSGGQRFGIGQTTGGLYFFHSASDPGTTGSPAVYDMTIADSGRIGIHTSTPAFPLTINTLGFGWVHTDGIREVGSYVSDLGGWLGTRSVDPLHLFTANSAPQVTLTTAGNFGIGTTNPGQRLDVNGRLRTRQGADGSAGMWLFQSTPATDRAFIGMRDDNAVGFFGPGGSGWGLTMNVTTGIVGIGTNTPNADSRLNVVAGGTGVQAVLGESPNGYGVVGTSAGAGYPAVVGVNSGVNGFGVFGQADSGSAIGVWGTSTQGVGVRGDCATDGGGSYGILGNALGGGYAGWFNGTVIVAGELRKNSGSFRIDHPLDPPNKYLSHSFVESPDMMNVYNGNITTDAEGYATITMPDWFEALNRDFRYQLTVLDDADSAEFVWAKVVKKVQDNRFTLRTSKPNVEVSWQVTGIRQDAWANAHRIVVEELKPEGERGKYLAPEQYGSPREMGIGYVPLPKARHTATEEEK